MTAFIHLLLPLLCRGSRRGCTVHRLLFRFNFLLHRDIALIELDGLLVVFAGVEVHFGLNLEDEVSGVSAEGLSAEVVFLAVH